MARALSPIDIGGVRAFNPGDLVPAEVVTNHGLDDLVTDQADQAAAAAAEWHATEVAPTHARETPQDRERAAVRAARAAAQKPPADDKPAAAKAK